MKTALITGSTKGIGREIGLDLLNRDYHVTFNYAHDTKGAELLRKQLDDPRLPRIKGDYQIIRADLSYIEELEKITKDITKLDVLILNTGITDRTPFGEIKESEWNKVFNTNLTVPFFLIQTLKDKINPNGKIIFVSSISGIIPDSISISYGVSKAAINMLVPYLAKEFAEKKITVNAVAPGYIMTDWHKNKPKSFFKMIKDKVPLGRIATTQDIANVVLFLASDKANYITGETIAVDGGLGLV